MIVGSSLMASSGLPPRHTHPKRPDSVTSEVVNSPSGNSYKYDYIKDKIGQGASATVYKVKDSVGNVFALKIFSAHYQNAKLQKIEIASRRHETQILQRLKIVDPMGEFFVREHESFEIGDKYYIVCDLLGEPLSSIYSRPRTLLSDIKQITTHILHHLKRLEQVNIVHGDLKPRNIVFDVPKKFIHTIDFGLSTDLSEDDPVDYHLIYQTPNYRSPEMAMVNEVIPGPQDPRNFNPTPKIDMWSLGCILVELYTRQFLFTRKGAFEEGKLSTDEENKILLLAQAAILGAPPSEMQEKCNLFKYPQFAAAVNAYKTNQLALHILNIKPKEDQTAEDQKIFPMFIDLVSKMLQHDPSQRITPEEALKHPFFEQVAVAAPSSSSSSSSASSSSISSSSSSSSASSPNSDDLIVASAAAGGPRSNSSSSAGVFPDAVSSHQHSLRKRKPIEHQCVLPCCQSSASAPAGKRNKIKSEG